MTLARTQDGWFQMRHPCLLEMSLLAYSVLRRRACCPRAERLGVPSLLYPCFKTALCYGVVSGCFVDSVSPSSPLRPEPAPKCGPAAPELAFRRPESARKVHAKSFGP